MHIWRFFLIKITIYVVYHFNLAADGLNAFIMAILEWVATNRTQHVVTLKIEYCGYVQSKSRAGKSS